MKSLASTEWNDYLLMFMTFSGNKSFYDFVVKYKIDKLPIVEKYKHVAVQWYMNSLRARVDGTEFNWDPPSTSELVLLAHKVKG